MSAHDSSVNLENVTREDWIVGGLAVLLAIFLVTLPWFTFSIGPFSFSYSATSAPDGWLGILAFIACLAVVADLAVERVSPQTEVPAIGNRTNTRFVLACVAALFVALKFLFHVHFGYFDWGFYVDVIVTVALVYFALQVRAPGPMTVTGPGRPAGRTGPGAARPRPDAGEAPGAGAPPGARLPPESRSGSGPPPGV